MEKKGLPQLLISNESLVSLVKNSFTKDSIIITDSYNYPTIKRIGQTVLITSCNADVVENIKERYSFSNILAVGGCTALDIARACAVDYELISFPTILSTTCISNNRSRLVFNTGSKLIKTNYPNETIISLPALLKTPPKELIRWTQSGFGDLFANVSASIDLQYKRNNLCFQPVQENVPKAFEALQWVLEIFETYNEECLKNLANYLHHSSLDVIKRDTTELSAGSEHILYHKMFEMQLVNNSIIATHGQIVGLGALITAKIYSEYTRNDAIYSDLKLAYEKLQLPTSYDDMGHIGIKKQYLIDNLLEIPEENSILGNYFSKNDFSILDTIFG